MPRQTKEQAASQAEEEAKKKREEAKKNRLAAYKEERGTAIKQILDKQTKLDGDIQAAIQAVSAAADACRGVEMVVGKSRSVRDLRLDRALRTQQLMRTLLVAKAELTRARTVTITTVAAVQEKSDELSQPPELNEALWE